MVLVGVALLACAILPDIDGTGDDTSKMAVFESLNLG
jgi:hypothetical protein